MPRTPNRPCSACGKLVWPTKGATSQTCRECRRKASPPMPRTTPVAVAGTTTTCPKCARPFVRTKPNQTYCWAPCIKQRSGKTPKAATETERGYGKAHAKAREKARAEWQDGDPCARCGGAMRYGTPVDLDHTDDRTGYLGLSHSSCNRSTTGRLQDVKHNKVCDHCGITYTTRYAAQRYCSIPCRKAAPRPERVAKPKPSRATYLRPCDECCAMFVAYTSKQRLCSDECRRTAWGRIMRLKYRRKVGIPDDAPLYSRAA